MHVYLLPTSLYTRTSIDLSVGLLLVNWSRSLHTPLFFTNTLIRLNISKMLSSTKSYIYLKLRSYTYNEIFVLRTIFFKGELIIYETHFSHFKKLSKLHFPPLRDA